MNHDSKTRTQPRLLPMFQTFFGDMSPSLFTHVFGAPAYGPVSATANCGSPTVRTARTPGVLPCRSHTSLACL